MWYHLPSKTLKANWHINKIAFKIVDFCYLSAKSDDILNVYMLDMGEDGPVQMEEVAGTSTGDVVSLSMEVKGSKRVVKVERGWK